jgi:hypothetical protein
MALNLLSRGITRGVGVHFGESLRMRQIETIEDFSSLWNGEFWIWTNRTDRFDI